MNRKILSLLLSGSILASVSITPAFAAENEIVPGNPEYETVDSTEPTGEALDDKLADGIEGNESNPQSDEVAWGSDYETATEFTIDSIEDLQAFVAMVNDDGDDAKDFAGKTVTLTASLDLTDVNWVPIGARTKSNKVPCFAGTFNGNGNTISNLNLKYGDSNDDLNYSYGGFIGYVTGEISDLNLENLNMQARSGPIGGIAGFLDKGGKISNCTVSGTLSGLEHYSLKKILCSQVGGIVGLNSGAVESCVNDCTITSVTSKIGGIAGFVKNGSISDCTNNGKLEGTGDVGGIAGDVTAESTNTAAISDCSNMGEIQGKESGSLDNRGFGGVVGATTGDVTISDCSNSGAISAQGQEWIGGIVGQLYFGSTVENCSNDASVTGETKVGGIVGYASAYSGGGYEIKGCENSGAISGTSEVGGIAGVTGADFEEDTILSVSGCTNTGGVSGTESVGGIVGHHNSGEGVGDDEAAATVSGCINTGTVPEAGGIIVGTNNTGTTGDSTNMVGKVENNFWPAELGENAVGSGAGSSNSESAEAVKNNSSYNADGTLTTPVTGSDGTEIKNLGDAIDKVIGGGEGGSENLPDAMKVTVTYNKNGHGTDYESVTVAMGKSVTLPSMDNDGYYTFTGWSDGSKTYQAGDTVTVMEDTTFTAQWRDDTPSSSGGSSSSTRYTVSVEDVDNGSIKVSPTRASKGSTVTITVTPDEGYELDKLIVTDKNGDKVKLTDKGDGKYTFKMPASKITVEATFAEIETEPETPVFTDVPTSAYYYDAVLWAVENGVTEGTSATTFSPDMSCTRAQMVTFLWRAAGSPEPVTTTNPFTDVNSGVYYYDAVLWAVEQGITSGTSATTFAPDATCTRAQTVTFLYRAAGSPAVSGGSFSDVSADAYYADAVAWAVSEGVTVGTSDTTFSPDMNCTRAQIVTFMYRAAQ